VESWRSEDGLSWYRKYRSGWIEQGGVVSFSEFTVSGTSHVCTITLTIPMKDTNYHVLCSIDHCLYDHDWDLTVVGGKSKTTSTIVLSIGRITSSIYSAKMYWEVKGLTK
jgi:hypothetical protein